MLWVGLLPIILIALITLITPITTPLPYCKKNGYVPKGVADQQSKNHILQKEYLPFYIFRSYAPTLLGIFGALWELSQVKQCATLKTFPKSRINPNCREIQIVTLFICVGAVSAPCRACDCVGTRPARTTESCYPRREVVAPRRRSVVVTPSPTNGKGPLFRFPNLLKISDRT